MKCYDSKVKAIQIEQYFELFKQKNNANKTVLNRVYSKLNYSKMNNFRFKTVKIGQMENETNCSTFQTLKFKLFNFESYLLIQL